MTVPRMEQLQQDSLAGKSVLVRADAAALLAGNQAAQGTLSYVLEAGARAVVRAPVIEGQRISQGARTGEVSSACGARS